MGVGFKVDFFWYHIGSANFLHSFFSTVAYNLENNRWGSRFPVIMNKLYQGRAEYEDIDKAMEELNIIQNELKAFSPDKVVWDIEDISKQPPCGNKISKDITDLSNYFITDEGDNLLTLLLHALQAAKKIKSDIVITSLCNKAK